MKALSLLQPWATLLAHGYKQVETRGYLTHFRGELAIHASLSPAHLSLCGADPFSRFVPMDGVGLPFGAVLGTAELYDVKPTASVSVSLIEYAFGNYAPGRYAWFFRNFKPFAAPIPAKGMLGLWKWEDAR